MFPTQIFLMQKMMTCWVQFHYILSKTTLSLLLLKQNQKMKNIKTLCALVAVVLFTACYNPNSSTSQEKSEETTVLEHGATEHGEAKPADEAHGQSAALHADTTMHGSAAMPVDSTMHADSTRH